MRNENSKKTIQEYARRKRALGEMLGRVEWLEPRTLMTSASIAAVSSANPATPLPAPWTSQDIGGPALSGSASVTNGAFTVTGSGSDIWNNADQFQYVDQTLSGDATLVARVSNQTNTDPWAKAGLMIRASSDPGAAFVDLVQTPGNAVALQWRSTAGSAPSAWTAGPTITGPAWLKLSRTGNSFTAWTSTDGVFFSQVGSVSVAMPTSVLAGLAVTSHNPSARSTATFDSVSLSQSTPASGAINLSSGFAGAGASLTLNGSARINGSRLTLTDNKLNESSSAFTAQPVAVNQFQTSFQFQVTHPSADGLTFTIQGSSPKALGGDGGGLGYQGIVKSIGIKFDLFNNNGEGVDSTGLYTNGAAPTTPSTDLSSSQVNLHSGDVFNVAMTYDGQTLKVTLTDAKTNASATQSYVVNIPGVVGGTTAYVGFTAGTGGLAATQEILNWTYTPTAGGTPTGPTADTQPPTTPANLALTASSDTNVAIRWDASTDNVGLAGYTVYRNGAKIATVPGGTTSFTDTGLTASTAYTYTVAAYDAAGNTSPASQPLSVTTSAASPAPVSAPSLPGTWNLAFNDDFNSVDPSVWSTRYWWDGNNGTQAAFNPSNVSTSNGTLSLTATQQSQTASDGQVKPYTSGLLTTGGIQGVKPAGFTFTYGYVEARSQIAPGQGMWSALWMLPADYNDNYELDVFENLGKSPNVDQGFLHAFGSGRFSAIDNTSTNLTQGFHTYGVDWEPDHISWYLDGKEIARDTNTSYIPNRPMYLILNLDVGGGWAGPLTSGSPTTSSWLVDYVRVWQHPSSQS